MLRVPNWAAAVWLPIVALTGGCARERPPEDGRGAASPLDSLTLTKTGSWPIPSGVRPLHVVRLESGAVLVVHADGANALSRRASEWPGESLGNVIPVLDEDGTARLLLQAESGVLLSASGHDDRGRCPSLISARQVVVANGVLVAVAQRATVDVVLVAVPTPSGECRVHTPAGVVVGAAASASLAVERGRVLIGNSDPSHAVLAVRIEESRFTIDPVPGFTTTTPVPSLDAAPPQRWAAMPLLNVGRGFLRIYADLTTPTRRIVLFDRAGDVVREIGLHYPLGMVSASPLRRELLGMIGGPHPRIVSYSWSWR